MTRGAAITGWGTALPERVVTNHDLEKTLDTNDQWIVERSGIRERRLVDPGEKFSTTRLSVEAGNAALKSAGLAPGDIDLLVLATTTPDQAVPATSSCVQHELGLRCGAFDLNAACSGWVYCLVVANSLVTTGVERILMIGAETLSRITDWDDRSTAVLFADGAGAVVLEASAQENMVGYDLGTDGSLMPILNCDLGSTLYMEGREVFRRAVRATVESANLALDRAGVTADDIALCVPHQANIRIIEAVSQRVGIGMDRMAIVLDRTGNTSSASIPLALGEAADQGRLKDGDLILFNGFGAGMTWASAVWRWTKS
jgi:3-oxoacyl-[acyl-carrier-protein] synthase III